MTNLNLLAILMTMMANNSTPTKNPIGSYIMKKPNPITSLNLTLAQSLQICQYFNSLTPEQATQTLQVQWGGRRLPRSLTVTIVNHRPYYTLQAFLDLPGVGGKILQKIVDILLAASQAITVTAQAEPQAEPQVEPRAEPQAEPQVEPQVEPQAITVTAQAEPHDGDLFGPSTRPTPQIEGVIDDYARLCEIKIEPFHRYKLGRKLIEAFEKSNTYDHCDVRFNKVEVLVEGATPSIQYVCALAKSRSNLFNSLEAAVAGYLGSPQHPLYTHTLETLKAQLPGEFTYETATTNGIEFTTCPRGRVLVEGSPVVSLDILTQQNGIYDIVPTAEHTGISPKGFRAFIEQLKVGGLPKRRGGCELNDLGQYLQIEIKPNKITVGAQIGDTVITHTATQDHTMQPGLFVVSRGIVKALADLKNAPGFKFVKVTDVIFDDGATINFIPPRIAGAKQEILPTEIWGRIFSQIAPFALTDKKDPRSFLKVVRLNANYAMATDGNSSARLPINGCSTVSIGERILKAVDSLNINWSQVSHAMLQHTNKTVQLVIHYASGLITTITDTINNRDYYPGIEYPPSGDNYTAAVANLKTQLVANGDPVIFQITGSTFKIAPTSTDYSALRFSSKDVGLALDALDVSPTSIIQLQLLGDQVMFESPESPGIQISLTALQK